MQARLSKGSIGFTSKIAPAPAPHGGAAQKSATNTAVAAAVAVAAVAEPSRVATAHFNRAGQVDSPQPDLSPLLEQVEPQDLVQFGLIPESVPPPSLFPLRVLPRS